MSEKYPGTVNKKRRAILKGVVATGIAAVMNPQNLLAANNPLEKRLDLFPYAQGMILQQDASLPCYASYFPPGTPRHEMELRICVPETLPVFDEAMQHFVDNQMNGDIKPQKRAKPEPLPREILTPMERLIEQYNSYGLEYALPRLKLVKADEQPHIHLFGFRQPDQKVLGFSTLPPAAEQYINPDLNARLIKQAPSDKETNIMLATQPGVVGINMADPQFKNAEWLNTVLMHEMLHACGIMHSESMGRVRVNNLPLPLLPDALKHRLSIMNRKTTYAQPQLLGPLELAIAPRNPRVPQAVQQQEIRLRDINSLCRQEMLQERMPRPGINHNLGSFLPVKYDYIVPPFSIIGRVENLVLPDGGEHLLDLNHGHAGTIFKGMKWDVTSNTGPAEQWIGCFNPDIRTVSVKGGEHMLFATQGAKEQAYEISGGKAEIVCCYAEEAKYIINATAKGKVTLTIHEKLLERTGPGLDISGQDIILGFGPRERAKIHLPGQLSSRQGVDKLRVVDAQGKEKYLVDLNKIQTVAEFESRVTTPLRDLAHAITPAAGTRTR